MGIEKVRKHEFGQLLTPKEVAKMIRRSEASLARDRYNGRGLPYIKYNRFIFYRIEDVHSYQNNHFVVPKASQLQAGAAN